MKTIAKRFLTVAFHHSEAWGMVWFGLIFWGSVLNAVARHSFTDASPWILACAAYAAGLAIGGFAKWRGRWM